MITDDSDRDRDSDSCPVLFDTLIIGQRPLTNQRIIEEGLRIVFFLSLSLFLPLLFLRKTGKNAAPSFSNLRKILHFCDDTVG